MNNLKRYTLYILNAVDIVSCILSYFLSMWIRVAFIRGFSGDRENYAYFVAVVLIAYFIVDFLVLYKDDKFLSRNALHELTMSIRISIFMMVIVLVYFNFVKISAHYSRLFEGIYFLSFALLDFILRTLVKGFLASNSYYNTAAEKVLLICSANDAMQYIHRINDSVDWRYKIVKIAVTNRGYKEKTINGIPVIQRKADVFSEETLGSIDGVIIASKSENTETIMSWINDFKAYGKAVHIQIPEFEISNSFRKLDNIGDLAVVTYRDLEPMSIRQQLLKRVIDIFVFLVTFPFYFVIYLLVKVFTTLESPGPVLVRRVRVGKNNRRFYQYRFRTYRTDADIRIEEGKTPYTFIGRVINALHIDGLPLILNLFTGDMSLVGPKAPNLPKYLDMSVRERNILTIRPGIVGYWTGEQDPIKAFEDEQNYLENWSLFKDISILSYCILRYISFRSLRIHGETHEQEEILFGRSLQNRKVSAGYKEALYTAKDNFLFSFIKRTVDIVLSLCGIIILSPIFLILTVMVTADDGGAPFYSHERVGKKGKFIHIYKFRSMRTDAGNLEELLTPEQLEQYKKEFKISDDPRITKLGEFLRRTSLDELPQLFNILKGEMSIVGPRPIVESELLEHYTEEEIAKLLSIKPGLTGYWQAYARNNAEYETHERQDMELYYVDHRSLLFDTKIFFKTFSAVFKQDGAK